MTKEMEESFINAEAWLSAAEMSVRAVKDDVMGDNKVWLAAALQQIRLAKDEIELIKGELP